MAKILLVLILIAGAAFFIYQRANVTPSEEEQLVKDLKNQFAAVVNQFTGAAGRAGMIGMDTTGDSGAAVDRVLKIRSDLAGLRQRLTEPKAISKADALSEKIENFCKKNDIIKP